MKTKHTPGPWHVVKYACYNSIQNGPMYGDMDLLNSDLCNEAEANAQLSAVAPELLEVLMELMEVYESKGQLLSFNVDIARQAIQKATS